MDYRQAPLDERVSIRFSPNRAFEASWEVYALDLVESVNAPFHAVLDLACRSNHAESAALLGTNAKVTFALGHVRRTLLGLVARVEIGPATARAQCRIHVEPAFALMNDDVKSRVFDGMNVPRILDDVIGVSLRSMGRSLDMRLLRRPYEARTYTLQYQETDFDFASRLMAEEGISYRFVHRGDTETMVLSDEDLTQVDHGSQQRDEESGVFPGRYLLTGARHVFARDHQSGIRDYENRFTCVPVESGFRPSPTRKVS